MKTESTAAEEHECEYRLIMETQDSNMKRLITDMARLKEELASERADRRAAASALYRAETQLDEAREEITKLEDEILDCTGEVLMSEQLRIYHIQNPPAPITWYEVNSPLEAIRKIEALTAVDLKNHDIWGNIFGLSVLEDGEWVDWCDEEGDDIDTWAEKNEVTRDHGA